MKSDLATTMTIDGERVGAGDGQTFDVVDPATTTVLAEVPRGGPSDVDAAVAAARSAQPPWADRRPVERARILHAVATSILDHRQELSEIESLDTGKPMRQARADVEVAARYFEFYAGLADKLLGASIPLGRDFIDFTTREPMGVSGQIVPWNYPLQIGTRGIAPALAAGNAVVVKPAEEAPLSLLRLGRIAIESGVPAGVLNVVSGTGAEAGARLAAHPGINQLTFTGSVEVGTEVMQAAARNIVPIVLELGGKCPMIVFDDADLDAACPVLVSAAIQNAGQTCSAVSRLIVARAVRDEVVSRVAALLGASRLAPGLDDKDMGPLITASQLHRVDGMVAAGQRAGAQVIVGGGIADEAHEYGGFFYQPTLLDGIAPGMAIAREEVFGPVLAVLCFDDEDEAVAMANATDYGLVAGVSTRDVSRAHRVASRLQAGQIYINGYGAAGGAELPFGGYKKSGFGREKGVEGLNSYLQTKNICLKL